MKRWQALAALAGLFVLGIAGGGLGAHLYYSRFTEQPPGPPGFSGPPFARQLSRHLDLDPEQARQVEAILADARRQAEAVRTEVAPRLREVMETSNRRIIALLTAEQRQRFERLQQRHRGRSERFFGDRGGEHRRRHRPPPPAEP